MTVAPDSHPLSDASPKLDEATPTRPSLLDEERGRAGGVYLFAERRAATAYLEGPIVKGLRENLALASVDARLFDVLEGPSVITRGLSPSGQTPEAARAPRAAV